MAKRMYQEDKPKDCRYCYYWMPGKEKCSLRECFYLIKEKPKRKSECDDCPYGRCSPCIGWCTKKLLREVGVK